MTYPPIPLHIRRSPFRIVGIGEILWDILPGGRQLGGAPTNFACHARSLGADVFILSRIGPDPLGSEALHRLSDAGIDTRLIQRDVAAPTGTATVQVDARGQPRFTLHENVAWDLLEAPPDAISALMSVDAASFGTLAQRTPPGSNVVQRLVRETPRNALRVFDLNLRQNYHSPRVIEESLELATVLKLNDTELPTLSAQFGLSGSVETRLSTLLRRFDLQLIALTLGERGSILATHDGVSRQPGLTVNVVDTVGAGDAFTAALTLGLLAHWPLDEINRFANEVACHVCTRAGATPPLPPHLAERFRPSDT